MRTRVVSEMVVHAKLFKFTVQTKSIRVMWSHANITNMTSQVPTRFVTSIPSSANLAPKEQNMISITIKS